MSSKPACWFRKNKCGDTPKAESAYRTAPAMVRLDKPAQVREDPITDKTGGCNRDAECSGKNVGLNARKGNVSRWKVTGGADFTTNQSVNWYEKG